MKVDHTVFNVEVTEPMEYRQLKPFLDDLKKKKMSFCIEKRKEGYVLWRVPIMGDKSMKPVEERGGVVEVDSCRLGRRRMIKYYVDGELVSPNSRWF